MTDRRSFISAVILGLVGAPFAAHAQQEGKVYRIGFLGNQQPTTPELLRFFEAFRQGLRERGWVEGRNIVIEWRAAEGSLERAVEQAAEMVRLKVDVIVAVAAGVTAAARATKTIPVVIAIFTDPVAFGYVASLAHPGGNLTGLSVIGAELNAKRLELLTAAVPRARRVAVLGNPTHRLLPQMRRDVEAAARSLRVEARFWEARDPNDFEEAFRGMSRNGVEALFVLEHPMFAFERKRIIDLAAKHRLPALYEFRAFAESGGLMTYGADYADMLWRSAYYVDKILRGAKPADLPVEQPTKFELVINLKTAKALGLTIPQPLLLRADEIIQ